MLRRTISISRDSRLGCLTVAEETYLHTSLVCSLLSRWFYSIPFFFHRSHRKRQIPRISNRVRCNSRNNSPLKRSPPSGISQSWWIFESNQEFFFFNQTLKKCLLGGANLQIEIQDLNKIEQRYKCINCFEKTSPRWKSFQDYLCFLKCVKE